MHPLDMLNPHEMERGQQCPICKKYPDAAFKEIYDEVEGELVECCQECYDDIKISNDQYLYTLGSEED